MGRKMEKKITVLQGTEKQTVICISDYDFGIFTGTERKTSPHTIGLLNV